MEISHIIRQWICTKNPDTVLPKILGINVKTESIKLSGCGTRRDSGNSHRVSSLCIWEPLGGRRFDSLVYNRAFSCPWVHWKLLRQVIAIPGHPEAHYEVDKNVKVSFDHIFLPTRNHLPFVV